MKKTEYSLLPEAGYSGEYDRKEGHCIIKTGTITDLIHDSKMLWGSDFDKVIPEYALLRKILADGSYGRLAEWDPIEIDEEDYKEIVQELTAIPMLRPYRLS